MNQKVKQQGFLRVLWLLHTLKKVERWSVIKVRIRIRIRPQTPGSGFIKKVWIRPDPDLQHCFQEFNDGITFKISTVQPLFTIYRI
jgi:hypothetical protein